MIKDVAVVICNWNRQDYIIKCIDSVLKSKKIVFDIIVVDNASTDDSVKLIEEAFSDQVHLIVKEQNTGGADGFNTGIKYALSKGYEYIYMLDNDVVIEEEALYHLYDLMKKNERVAVVGSKILYMNEPERIQYLGAQVNWNAFLLDHNYSNVLDHEELPEVIYTDIVPACSLLVRSEVILKAGGMDPEYFIYFDDVDMCYSMKQLGYEVCVYTKSVIYHARGVLNRQTTFADFYSRRNANYFYAKFVEIEKVPLLAKKIVEGLFKEYYFGMFNGREVIVRSRLYAILDLLEGRRGKAPEDRISPVEPVKLNFLSKLNDFRKVAIVVNCVDVLIRLINDILEQYSFISITLIIPNDEGIKSDIDSISELNLMKISINDFVPAQYDQVIQICDHVSNYRNYIEWQSDIYVDNYYNVIQSENDKTYIDNKEQSQKNFYALYTPIIVEKLYKLKESIAKKH